jgi:hypothetical protein
MKKKHIIYSLILCILFVYLLWIAFGAMVGGLTHSKRLGKTNYYLVEGITQNVDLRYEFSEYNRFWESIVDGHITDAYWNEQYILITQYYSYENRDSIEGYYIIKMLPPVKKGVPWETAKFSTKEEYEQKKQELSLNEKEMQHTVFR